MAREITASRFKAQCLALLDEVNQSGEPLVVTKHGKPVARLVPIDGVPPLRGTVTFLVSDAELVAPLLDARWDADEPTA